MRKVYSGDGAKPNIGPFPISIGLMYKDPFPGGGTCVRSFSQGLNLTSYLIIALWLIKGGYKGKEEGGGNEGYKGFITQDLLALAVCLTASINWWMEGEGMHILSAPLIMRVAFSFGRKSRIQPSSLLYAFVPSYIPYIFNI